MAHIGNSPASYFTAVTTDVFSANGTATAFTLSKYVSNLADLEIVVNNIQQNPYSGSYSVSNNTLTFSEAPLAGSNNIVVTYRQATIGSTIPTPNTVGNNALQRDLSFTGNTTTQHLVPAANITYDIGTSTMRYRDLYLSGNTINLGDLKLSTNGTSFSVANATGGVFASALGNTVITGTLAANATAITGNVSITGTQFVNGAVTFANSTSNTVFIAANGNIGWGNSTPVYPIDISKNDDGSYTGIGIRNANSGVSASARVVFFNDLTNAAIALNSTGASNTGYNRGSTLSIHTSGSSAYGGISIAARSANGYIDFYTGGSTQRMVISKEGYVNTLYQPSFNAGLSVTSANSSTSPVILFDVVDHNVGGHYSSSTGRFTAPIAGRYLFTTTILFQDIQEGVHIYFQKNGSTMGYGARLGANAGVTYGYGGYCPGELSMVINLNAGDYTHVRIAGGGTSKAHGNYGWSFFTGHLLG